MGATAVVAAKKVEMMERSFMVVFEFNSNKETCLGIDEAFNYDW